MSVSNNYMVLSLFFLISGCVTKTPINTPVPGSPGVEQARQSKPVDEQVLWGGVIVSIDNKPGYSVIEIVDRPLTKYGKPEDTEQTGGRFLAKKDTFIEPENAQAGRYITISGIIESYQEGVIGEFLYTFPVVRINEYKVWPVSGPSNYPRYYSPYWYDPYWGPYPYYGPYYGASFFYSRHRHHNHDKN